MEAGRDARDKGLQRVIARRRGPSQLQLVEIAKKPSDFRGKLRQRQRDFVLPHRLYRRALDFDVVNLQLVGVQVRILRAEVCDSLPHDGWLTRRVVRRLQ